MSEQTAKKTGLAFGEAIEALRAGKRVTRPGWNGKGMYLWYMPPCEVKEEWCREKFLRLEANAKGGSIQAEGSVRMMTAQGTVLTGWLATQTDMFATDWEILEDCDSDPGNYCDAAPAGD